MSNPEVIDISSDNEEEEVRTYEVSVLGKPRPLPRMRHFRNGLWNKAKGPLLEFKAAVKKELPTDFSMYRKGVPITLTIWFYLPRPITDFVGGKRTPGNLKPAAATDRAAPLLPDIDNLIKFVLDALNGLVYEDDRQIVKITAYKLRDNNMTCTGATRMKIEKYLE